jgi:hypothetical protein
MRSLLWLVSLSSDLIIVLPVLFLLFGIVLTGYGTLLAFKRKFSQNGYFEINQYESDYTEEEEIN